jgi:SAM-dependent methyltransferase
VAVPTIFSPARRAAAQQRLRRLQARLDAPRYLIEDMAEDLIERLAFLRHAPRRALVVGDWSGALSAALAAAGAEVAATEVEDSPLDAPSFDLVASVGPLDTVNDLPGALIRLRLALAPGGLFLASFTGAGCLPRLRSAMLAADGERPAPRLHPMVDVRAGAELLQRAGYADPVADSRTLTVRFASLDRLVADLRAQGLGNVLARPGPPLGRAALARARSTFGQATEERFEILTLTGWRRSV